MQDCNFVRKNSDVEKNFRDVKDENREEICTYESSNAVCLLPDVWLPIPVVRLDHMFVKEGLGIMNFQRIICLKSIGSSGT